MTCAAIVSKYNMKPERGGLPMASEKTLQGMPPQNTLTSVRKEEGVD